MWTVRFVFVNIQKVKTKIILVVNSGETKFQQLSIFHITLFIIKHTHPSGRNVILDLSDRFDGGAWASVCGRSGGVCQACTFFPATNLTGTGRVDTSVQLLIGLVILLHYKCRP